MSRRRSREAKLEQIRKLKVEIKRLELEIELEDYKASMSGGKVVKIDPTSPHDLAAVISGAEPQ